MILNLWSVVHHQKCTRIYHALDKMSLYVWRSRMPLSEYQLVFTILVSSNLRSIFRIKRICMCFGGLLEQQSSFQELDTSICKRKYSFPLSLGFSLSAPPPDLKKADCSVNYYRDYTYRSLLNFPKEIDKTWKWTEHRELTILPFILFLVKWSLKQCHIDRKSWTGGQTLIRPMKKKRQ